MATPMPYEARRVKPDTRPIVDVRVGEIIIDRNAQRELNWERVARLAHEWDWEKSEMVTCSRRPDGRLYVVEGQHRIAALKKLDPATRIRILVVSPQLTIADESDLQLRITTARRPHDALSKWELRVNRGDQHEVTAAAVIDGHGLRLGRGAGPHTIAGVSVIYQLIHARRQPPEVGGDLLNRLLTTIEAAYPEEDQPDSRTTRWDHRLLKAVGELLMRNPHVEETRLIEALQERIAQQWILPQDTDQPLWEKIAETVAKRYNRGLRNDERKIQL